MNRLLIRISPAAGSLPTAITETASTTASGRGGGEGEKSQEDAGHMKNCEEQERGKSEAGSSFSNPKKSECREK